MENVSYLRRSISSVAVALLLLPAFAIADSTISISPTTWGSTADTINWTVGGSPNSSMYIVMFNPDGTANTRNSTPPQSAVGTYAITVATQWSGEKNPLAGATGTLHAVSVNVDSGSGFSGWSTNCDQVASTYAGCSTYLLGDSRTGYTDSTLTYVPTFQLWAWSFF